jgi:hypothetical protein
LNTSCLLQEEEHQKEQFLSNYHVRMQNPFHKPSKCSFYCKTGGPKASIETGYETWICKLG